MNLMERIIAAHFRNKGYGDRYEEGCIHLTSQDNRVRAILNLYHGELRLRTLPNISFIPFLGFGSPLYEISTVQHLDINGFFDGRNKNDIKKNLTLMLNNIHKSLALFGRILDSGVELTKKQRQVLDELQKHGFREEFRTCYQGKEKICPLLVASKRSAQIVITPNKVMVPCVSGYASGESFGKSLNIIDIDKTISKGCEDIGRWFDWSEEEYINHIERATSRWIVLPSKTPFIASNPSYNFSSEEHTNEIVRLKNLIQSVNHQKQVVSNQPHLTYAGRIKLVDALRLEFVTQMANVKVEGAELFLCGEPEVEIQGELVTVEQKIEFNVSGDNGVKTRFSIRLSTGLSGVVDADINDTFVEELTKDMIDAVGRFSVVTENIDALLSEDALDELSINFEAPKKISFVHSAIRFSEVHIPVKDRFFDENVNLVLDVDCNDDPQETYDVNFDHHGVQYGYETYVAERAERIKNAVLSEMAKEYGI